ncbi:MAG TPA: pyridoxal phosphate-dependent aminotransferase [Thermoanaerobaculia bacterium]|nr:pyridoxal phosphate-dependent aminotransferase [Thermoanaerobaculia bacterium]
MTSRTGVAPSVSARGGRVPASPIRKLMPLAENAKRRGVRVLHLNIGQPDLETPSAMRDRLARYPERVIAYSPSGGTPEYLAFLVEYYRRLGLALSPDELIATTGGSEAILFALLACADPGDEALVVEPFYTNYSAFAAMAGVELVALTSRVEDGFHLPAREVWERACTSRTRVVLLCNPNNPTGTVYSPEELARVASFCRDRGLFLLADEVYREFVYDGRRTVSALSLEGSEEFVVLVDSLSKRYSACGIRLGCLATRNREIHRACLRMAQGRLSPPGLAQFVAVGALDLGPDYTARVVAEYERRRDVLYEGLRRLPGVFLQKPEGAFYFVARLPIDDGDDFASWLLTEFQLEGATVMIAPARGFYATPGLGTDQVRIAYVLEENDLRIAVDVLAAALHPYVTARGGSSRSRSEIVAPEDSDFALPQGT